MAEKPIIFSTPMVQTIMAGKKTQTRRAVNAPGHQGVRKAYIYGRHRQLRRVSFCGAPHTKS